MIPTAGSPVVVVGSGPVGMTTALLLADLGVETLLVERHLDLYPLPRAVHLDDEVFRILQRAGVADQFAAVSRPMPGLRLVDRDLRTLAEFRRDRALGDHGYPQANMFDQPDLEVLLLQQVRSRPEITVRRGSELVGLCAERPDDPSGVLVTTREVSSGISQTFSTPAVLGCDGANSTVRRLIGGATTSLGPEDRWLVVDVVHPGRLEVWDGVQQVCDRRRAATFMPIGPDRYRWEFRLLPHESAADLRRHDTLVGLLAPWIGAATIPDLTVVRSNEYVFKAQVADRWSHGRVFLLGDAAHLTPPFIGQGLGLGLRDAANLAWKLAAVLRDGADERLLLSYAAEREPHARRLIRMAVLMGRAMTGGENTASALRHAVLASLRRVPRVTARLADTTTPPLARGPLIRRRRTRAALRGRRDITGQLIPQPWIRAAGQRLRLDEVLGFGYTVITDGVLDEDLLTLGRRLRATVVVLREDSMLESIPGADEFVIDCTDENHTLRTWLRSAGARAVLVRPDRVVLAVARHSRGSGAELSRGALPLTDLLATS